MSKLWYICGCFFVFLYSVSIPTSFVAADKHTYGSTELNVNHEVILNRRIFMRNTSMPTNYTIIYKYVRSKLGGLISYIEFDVANCVSTGKIDMQEANENDELVITANLHVENCKNLNLTAQILGHGASIASQLSTQPYNGEIYGDKLFEPKSFALIYAHNETRSMDRFFKIGQRQSNDTLLKSDEITVNNELDSFPQCEIEYNDPNTVITQIGFKFNSPTATAFLNSSYIQESSFNAIAYDLNRPQFTVKFNVYGYNANAKPAHYKSILTF